MTDKPKNGDAEKNATDDTEKKVPFMDRLGRAYDSKGSGLSQLALLSLFMDEASGLARSLKKKKPAESAPTASAEHIPTAEEMYKWHQEQTQSSPFENGCIILILFGCLAIGGFLLAWTQFGAIVKVAMILMPVLTLVWFWRKFRSVLQLRHKRRLESVWHEMPVALRDAGVTFVLLCESYREQGEPEKAPWTKTKEHMEENLNQRGFWNEAFEREIDNLMLEVMQLATKAYPSKGIGQPSAEANVDREIRVNYTLPFPEDTFREKNAKSRPLVAGLKKALAKA